jgi:polyphosphate kinase 2 (PPK2 family)
LGGAQGPEGRRDIRGAGCGGKGGVIKHITQRLNPRVCRATAVPAPSERERTQWYFQRYVAHLPAAGEIVLFDRSCACWGHRQSPAAMQAVD